jgi:hypothetical protein
MTGYEQFKQAKPGIAEKAAASLLSVGIQGATPAFLESVQTLQSRVLTVTQLDALAQIQEAVRVIGQMQQAVNSLATLNRLPVRRVMLAEAGFLLHDIEGLLFDHNSAAARLRNGGVQVHEGESELRRESRAVPGSAAA